MIRHIPKIAILAAAVWMLSGCAEDYLNPGLTMLNGKPVTQAVKYLGYPTEEKNIMGKIMHSWITYHTGSLFVPNDVPYPVVVQHGAYPQVVYSTNAASHVEEQYSWRCRLDVISEQGVIVHTQYQQEGNACQIFGNRLKPLVLPSK